MASTYSPSTASFKITRLGVQSPFRVLRDNWDPANSPFEPHEVRRITASIGEVRDSVAGREDLRPEQVDYINRKLDDLVEATGRVGRKDWVNLVVGTSTNIVVSAAIGSDAGKFLF